MKTTIFLTFLFISSISGIFIHCNFNYDSNWVVIGRVYTCDATILSVSGNLTNFEGYNGTHLAGNTSSDVRMVDFNTNSNCNQLSSIPSGFLDFFPNLSALYFIECGINSFNGFELFQYQSLEWFGLYRSDLEIIPGYFFNFTRQIRFINFNSNQIRIVGENLLENLPNLERVYFNNNICISKTATDAAAIAELKEVLRTNCSDSETTTTIYSNFTTTTSWNFTTTTFDFTNTTTPIYTNTTTSWCQPGNSDIRICQLESKVDELEFQVEFLFEENVELRGRVDNLEERLRRIEELIDGCPWC